MIGRGPQRHGDGHRHQKQPPLMRVLIDSTRGPMSSRLTFGNDTDDRTMEGAVNAAQQHQQKAWNDVGEVVGIRHWPHREGSRDRLLAH
jgi:hypothetical protein